MLLVVPHIPSSRRSVRQICSFADAAEPIPHFPRCLQPADVLDRAPPDLVDKDVSICLVANAITPIAMETRLEMLNDTCPLALVAVRIGVRIDKQLKGKREEERIRRRFIFRRMRVRHRFGHGNRSKVTKGSSSLRRGANTNRSPRA